MLYLNRFVLVILAATFLIAAQPVASQSFDGITYFYQESSDTWQGVVACTWNGDPATNYMAFAVLIWDSNSHTGSATISEGITRFRPGGVFVAAHSTTGLAPTITLTLDGRTLWSGVVTCGSQPSLMAFTRSAYLYDSSASSNTQTAPAPLNDSPKSGYDLTALFAINDGRVNSYDLAAPVAIYSGTIRVYGIDPATAEGTFMFTISDEAVEAAGIPAEGAVILQQGVHPFTGEAVTVYRLSTGEFQLNTKNFDGSDYVFIWD